MVTKKLKIRKSKPRSLLLTQFIEYTKKKLADTKWKTNVEVKPINIKTQNIKKKKLI